MQLPASRTIRGPNRSISMPQPKLATPMARKLNVIASEIAVRDQPVATDIGSRNTGSEKIEPIAIQPMNPPAATITQRYPSCFSGTAVMAFPFVSLEGLYVYDHFEAAKNQPRAVERHGIRFRVNARILHRHFHAFVAYLA